MEPSELEIKLNEADEQAIYTKERLSHEIVFQNVKNTINGK